MPRSAKGACLPADPRTRRTPGEIRIAVRDGAGDGGRARRLAGELSLPLTQIDDGFDYLLEHTASGLELRDTRDAALKPVRIDLPRRRVPLSRRQPLGRALGRPVRSVIDATAGLGGDTVLLARMGLEVTAMERSPVIAALLEDALERSAEFAVDWPIRLVRGDGRDRLASLDPPPDVVFLDPMYPPGRKPSVRVGKEVGMLREIVGDDSDAAELLAEALRCARRRVVVKRPLRAEPLAGAPAASHAGKLARYDVYPAAGR